MVGFVFSGNSSKPSKEKSNGREPVVPGDVSIPCIEAAIKMGYKVFWGTNRNNPQELSCKSIRSIARFD